MRFDRTFTAIKIQCLHTIEGCIDTLERMQLVQATGQMYDEYLFQRSSREVVRDSRVSFEREVETHPPVLFIVAASLFPSGPGGYDKLAQWPDFDGWLNQHYALAVGRRP